MKIVINTKDNYKYCPVCKRLYSSEYNYCTKCENDNELLEVEFQ